MDARDMDNRVLFLGPVGSFAVDAARLGMSSGCAYFIDRRELIVNEEVIGDKKATMERSRVFRFSFHDDKTEFIQELPRQ